MLVNPWHSALSLENDTIYIPAEIILISHNYAIIVKMFLLSLSRLQDQ